MRNNNQIRTILQPDDLYRLGKGLIFRYDYDTVQCSAKTWMPPHEE